MDFLRSDLVHLFDGTGIDKSAYEEKVDFQVHTQLTLQILSPTVGFCDIAADPLTMMARCLQDPITNYNTLTGAAALLADAATRRLLETLMLQEAETVSAAGPYVDSRAWPCAGYLFNIQFLRFIFGPNFILHDLRRTGDWEVTSRWTMEMKLQVGRGGTSSHFAPCTSPSTSHALTLMMHTWAPS